MCSLEETNYFLDETYGQSVKVQGDFDDTDKLIMSVIFLQRLVGFGLLDEKKCYCLKKHIIVMRKAL